MARLIEIKDIISTDLALREMADMFFTKLELLTDDEISISFANIRSISRSFAHQFIVRRKLSKKKIQEVNLPPHVQKMFTLVEQSVPGHQSRKVLDLDSMQTVTV